jgi:hypothetical protein
MPRNSRLFCASCTVSVLFLFSISSAYAQEAIQRQPRVRTFENAAARFAALAGFPMLKR